MCEIESEILKQDDKLAISRRIETGLIAGQSGRGISHESFFYRHRLEHRPSVHVTEREVNVR